MIHIGLVGVGAAGRAFLPAIEAHPAFTLAAAADPVARVEGVRMHADLRSLLDDAIDAVCIATPTHLHAEHAIAAFAAGKHVLLEKPMATSIADAIRIIEAAQRAGKVLLVGHSHSYDAPIARMRALVDEGALGAVRMANTWCFTDWMLRPRRPEELDPLQGGGVVFRQGAHQLDILRLLCGGAAKSVRAKTFDAGAHVAFVEFKGGAAATAVYSGYGHLPGAELTFGIGEWGVPQAPGRSAPVRGAIPARAPHPPFFGLTILSCERGDVRQAPDGLSVCTREGNRTVDVPVDRSPRELVLDEFEAAITRARPPLHDGRWALATLELSIAVLESSRLDREVELRYQVAVPRGR